MKTSTIVRLCEAILPYRASEFYEIASQSLAMTGISLISYYLSLFFTFSDETSKSRPSNIPGQYGCKFRWW